MAPSLDNDGPSDEEASDASNSLLQSPPKPREDPSAPPSDSPEESPPPPRGKRRKNERGKGSASVDPVGGSHEGKIIEIGRSSRATEGRYESFPPRSRSARPPSRDPSSRDGAEPIRKERIGRARQVLVHYHPQMGDEGYESTLLDARRESRGRSSPPAARRGRAGRGGSAAGGMHSRMIDDVREKEARGSDREGDAAAAARRSRRRALRTTLERTPGADRRPREARSAEGGVGGPSGRRGREGGEGDGKEAEVRPEGARSKSTSEGGGVPPTPSPSGSRSRPPPPPSAAPSYRLVVALLIGNNEPEKLTQVDRVMEKYRGREEELIAKLDLRYRKKRRERVKGMAERVVGRSAERSVRHSPRSVERSVNSGFESRAEDMPPSSKGAAAQKPERSSQKSVAEDLPERPELEKNAPVEQSSPDVEKEEQSLLPGSPSKSRTAILTMQSWDRRGGDDDTTAAEKEDDSVPREAVGGDGDEIMTPNPIGRDEIMPSDPNPRRNGSKAPAHSNAEKDIEDGEGRLPKVPERDAIEPAGTPTRAIDPEKTQGAPAFGDDISLITTETKGTSHRNRGEGGDAACSFAEMTRRPPASIIVDGGSPRGADGPASAAERDGEDSEPAGRERRQSAPPKIRRLLPEYEKASESEKSRAAEASQRASAKLDGVEARIRARRRLREEEARKTESQQQSGGKVEMKTLEEHAAVAFDEEESFLGEAKKNARSQSRLIRGAIESGSSLIEDEANQRSSIDGTQTKVVKSVAGEFRSVIGDESSLMTEDVSQREVVDNNRHVEERSRLHAPSFDDEVPLDEARSLPRRSAPPKEDELPLDEPNEIDAVCKVNQTQAVEDDEDYWSRLRTRWTLKVANNRQNEEDEAAVIKQAASRDAEIKLKEMEDEIARLVAEKESRFAAEKAVALKKAERALEEERKARLEAEKARLNAEKELERLKAEAEERLKLIEAEKEQERLRVEAEERQKLLDAEIERERLKIEAEQRRKRMVAERTLERLKAEAEEKSKAARAEVEQRSLPTPLEADARSMPKHADMIVQTMSTDEQSAPLDETVEEQSMSVDSMDHETKAELLSMIAAMEAQTMLITNTQSAGTEPEPELHAANAVGDSVLTDQDADDDNSVDIVEKMRSVWASDGDESQHEEYAPTSDDESDYEIKGSSYEKQLNDVPRSALMVDVDEDENDSEHSGEQSYLPGTLSPDRISMTIPSSDLHDLPSMTMPQGPLDKHDFASFTMPHRPVGTATQNLDASKSRSSPTEETQKVKNVLPMKPSVLDEEEGEANIHHVARVTFDGDASKGQLSFTTGSEVLAHSNQRGDWWLGRCGGRTGWFPASAIVPASQFLRSQLGTATNGLAASAGDEVDDVELPKLSQEELHQVYDLIRSPSGEDESPKRVRKDVSPPRSPRLDPSESSGLKERLLYEPNQNDQNDVRSAFDSMMNAYDSMLAPSSVSNSKEEMEIEKGPSLTVASESKQSELNTTTNTEEKRPKRLWREANDPNTGLTYYYNIKTRETTWDKPADFVERKSPAKPPTPTELNRVDQDVSIKEATAKDNHKSIQTGGKRFLGLFSKALSKRNNPEMSPKSASSSSKTVPTTLTFSKTELSETPQPGLSSSYQVGSQAKKEADADVDENEDTQNHITNETVSFLNDDIEDDESSVSSEATSNSIFSTKRMKEALGKVTSKITGKKTSSPANASYDALNDSLEQNQTRTVKNVHSDKLPVNSDDKLEQPVKPSVDSDSAKCQTESVPEKKPAAEVKPTSSGKKKDSRWRSAIDPLTGRTYYFHKDTKETVWEKPKNL